MATSICSLFLTPQSLQDLKLTQPEDTHYALYCVPFFNSLASSGTTLGVVLSGQRTLQHLILVSRANTDWNQNHTASFSCTITCCDGSVMKSNTQCKIKESGTTEDLDYVIGIIFEPFRYIGFKAESNAQDVTVTPVADSLLQRIANLHKRPKRKRAVLEAVTVKNIGLLPPQAAHDAAHVWMEYHAKDSIIIDFVPKRGEQGETVGSIRRFRVKNDKDEFVIVRTLRECIKYVQHKTGRDFWEDMLNNGDQYNLQPLQRTKESEGQLTDAAASTDHGPSHDDLFGSSDNEEDSSVKDACDES